MILDAIVARKRAEVRAARERLPEAALRRRAGAAPPAADLVEALVRGAAKPGGFPAGIPGVAVIAEFKRRSPSAGAIRPGADAADLARRYAAGGAAALSVLTDGPSFGGWAGDLAAARAAAGLPVLRKDFILDPYQVWESRAMGADGVLLIARCLAPGMLRELAGLAMALGMAPLVEVHTPAELEAALRTDAPLIGINSRDLQTFITDLGVVERLAPQVPAGRLVVAESGIRGPADVRRVAAAGARAVLVGERLMAAPEPAVALRWLLGVPPYGPAPPEGRVRVKICGLRTPDAARAAVRAGADAVGLIFAPARRQVTPDTGRAIAEAARRTAAERGEPVAVVGVFRDAPPEEVERVAEAVGLDVLQLHGAEPPAMCQAFSRPVVKAIGVARPGDLEACAAYDGKVSALLLDARSPEGSGGTGRSFPWEWVAAGRLGVAAPVILAGGLRAETVRAALDAVGPYGVDVSSGVETDGEKDPQKIAAFLAAARAWRRSPAAGAGAPGAARGAPGEGGKGR